MPRGLVSRSHNRHAMDHKSSRQWHSYSNRLCMLPTAWVVADMQQACNSYALAPTCGTHAMLTCSRMLSSMHWWVPHTLYEAAYRLPCMKRCMKRGEAHSCMAHCMTCSHSGCHSPPRRCCRARFVSHMTATVLLVFGHQHNCCVAWLNPRCIPYTHCIQCYHRCHRHVYRHVLLWCCSVGRNYTR